MHMKMLLHEQMELDFTIKQSISEIGITDDIYDMTPELCRNISLDFGQRAEENIKSHDFSNLKDSEKTEDLCENTLFDFVSGRKLYPFYLIHKYGDIIYQLSPTLRDALYQTDVTLDCSEINFSHRNFVLYLGKPYYTIDLLSNNVIKTVNIEYLMVAAHRIKIEDMSILSFRVHLGTDACNFFELSFYIDLKKPTFNTDMISSRKRRVKYHALKKDYDAESFKHTTLTDAEINNVIRQNGLLFNFILSTMIYISIQKTDMQVIESEWKNVKTANPKKLRRLEKQSGLN